MALDQHALDALCTSGFGPLTLESAGSTWEATVSGRAADVSLHDGALAVTATRPVTWPDGAASADEALFRVAVALRKIELERPELCCIEPSAAHDAVVVRIWLDAVTATPFDLACAARTAIALGDVAALALDRLRAAIASEDEARAAAERAVATIEQARAALVARATGGGTEQPTPATPAATAAPSAGDGATATRFVATHRIPIGGLPAWERPDPSLTVIATIGAGVLVRRLEQRDDGWAHIVCDNDWSAWIDGRRLEALG